MCRHKIKLANFHSYSILNFSKVAESKVTKEILNSSSKKGTKNGDILAKIVKRSFDIYIQEITLIINGCIEIRIFSDDLNLANVSPIFKKDILKKNIINQLPHMSKVFERIL